MNRLLFAWALCIGLLGSGENGHAHEMGTSALIVHEGTPSTGQFVFKRTVGSDDKIPPIDFKFEPACELRDVSTEWEGNTELIQRGNFFCSKSLAEHEILANGFTRLAPDLIVLATPQQSDRIHAVLTPKKASVALGNDAHKTHCVWAGPRPFCDRALPVVEKTKAEREAIDRAIHAVYFRTQPDPGDAGVGMDCSTHPRD